MTDWNQARFAGWSHKQIYDAVQKGPGASGSHEAQDAVKLLNNTLDNVEQEITTAMNRLGAAWEGAAADAHQSAMTPLKQWTAEARAATGDMQKIVTQQADTATNFRSKIPPPKAVPSPAR
jgi:uncharacterized protein YukE